MELDGLLPGPREASRGAKQEPEPEPEGEMALAE